MNKITFRLDTDFDLEFDFRLIGINSPLKNYRLCHFINKHTGINFMYGKEDHVDNRGNQKEKTPDELDYHVVPLLDKEKKCTKNHFKTYRYCTPDFEKEYYLISNRSEEGFYLLPEAAQFDEFLIIKHYINNEDILQLISEINHINEVVIAKEIDPKALKSKENLIF